MHHMRLSILLAGTHGQIYLQPPTSSLKGLGHIYYLTTCVTRPYKWYSVNVNAIKIHVILRVSTHLISCIQFLVCLLSEFPSPQKLTQLNVSVHKHLFYIPRTKNLIEFNYDLHSNEPIHCAIVNLQCKYLNNAFCGVNLNYADCEWNATSDGRDTAIMTINIC